MSGPLSLPPFRKRLEHGCLPQNVRFTECRVEPWPDGRRIRIHVDITPFQQFPNLEITISDPEGVERAHTLIVETAEHRIVFTLHLRGGLDVSFTLTATLSYPDVGTVDTAQVDFTVHPGSDQT